MHETPPPINENHHPRTGDASPPAFRLRDRAASFLPACRGVPLVLRSQHNAWIHLAATLAVIILGLVCDVSRRDWLWLVLAIAMVWMAEAINTAIEAVCDRVSTQVHPLVRNAKDAAAGAVLIAAVAAAVIGLLVFWPYLADILASAGAERHQSR